MELNDSDLTLKPEDYAAVYARKSIKVENSSIQSQLSLARDVLRKNNLLLYKEYWDEESATKFSPYKRQGFSELLKDAKAGKFKTLIVFRRDRLARKASDLIEIKNLFRKLKIKIIYSNTGEYQPSDSYISNFIENIIMAVDELEPQVVAERTRIGKAKKRERREYSGGAYLPFGFIKVEKGNKAFYDGDESKVGIVKAIFNEYAKNDESYGISYLVKYVNSISGSNVFTSQKITNIIKNPVYAGYQFRSTSKKLEDLFIQTEGGNFDIDTNLLQQCSNVAPIIDFELWANCITKWRQNYKSVNKSLKKTYLFKGLLQCGGCERPISLIGGRYKCQAKQCTSIEEGYLQKELIKTILGDIRNEGKIITYIDRKIASYRQEIQKIRRELNLNMAKLDQITSEFIKRFNKNDHAEDVKKLIISELAEQENLKSKISEQENKIYKLNELRSNLEKNGFIEGRNLARHLLSNTEKTQDLLIHLLEKVIVIGKDDDFSIQDVRF